MLLHRMLEVTGVARPRPSALVVLPGLLLGLVGNLA
jgi:hypothetical protein